MAWTDQCKIAFKSNAKARFYSEKKQTKGKLKDILSELSQESGIPYKTLERWWYEQRSEENKKILKTEEARGRPTKLQQKREKKKKRTKLPESLGDPHQHKQGEEASRREHGILVQNKLFCPEKGKTIHVRFCLKCETDDCRTYLDNWHMINLSCPEGSKQRDLRGPGAWGINRCEASCKDYCERYLAYYDKRERGKKQDAILTEDKKIILDYDKRINSMRVILWTLKNDKWTAVSQQTILDHLYELIDIVKME